MIVAAAPALLDDVGAGDPLESGKLLHRGAVRRLRDGPGQLVDLHGPRVTARDHDGLDGVERIERVEPAVARGGGEDGRVVRRPTDIGHVVGPRLEGEERLAPLLVPQLDGPVGRAREEGVTAEWRPAQLVHRAGVARVAGEEPVLGARHVDHRVAKAKVEAQARGAARDDALGALAVCGRGDSLEHHQVGVLQPLLHVPLRDAPVGRDGHQNLALPLALVDPLEPPYGVCVLAGGVARLEHWRVLRLAHVVDADGAVIQPDGEQVRVALREGDAGDATRGGERLVGAARVLERPKEDEPLLLVEGSTRRTTRSGPGSARTQTPIGAAARSSCKGAASHCGRPGAGRGSCSAPPPAPACAAPTAAPRGWPAKPPWLPWAAGRPDRETPSASCS
eukprot:scaffold4502_cov119-Isochrysis_galbana.AAC.14